ncbi:glycosyl hydrolase [Phialemonium atrogriseum]|uniref:beta-fructofuranosidase n=1 Tax=Phialemonium atrogriseum TaxID=1093897 RepID=A0AAJ0C132_9PEZI|nr:glycosyl hydrolase [Phialemonium atrogriseum]KAK1767567.1 glycosyl hydrolase [Phialemonium atrogriseum]
MGSTGNEIPTPPPEGGSYTRISPAQAAADAIPILVDDTYHLFHLTTPPFTRHHPQRLRSCWWRMRSKNLVDWTRDDEPSVKPGESATSPDADGAWTGAAVLGPDGNMNIFYTGYSLSQGGKQVILRARSQDRHGGKFQQPGSEISFSGDGRSKLEDIDFRDPYVFYNEAESQYWMIIASRLASGPFWSRGCVALLKSTDLDTWTFEPEPLYSPNDMFCPECPELFTLPNGKWYLVYSRFHAPDSGTVYRVADSPYGPFRVPRDGSNGRLDGRRWYAAKSCPKAGDPSRRIFFGWIGDYVEDEGKWLWGGDFGVPREVSADEKGNLRITTVSEVEQLFDETSAAVPPKSVPSKLSLASLGSTMVTFPDLSVAEGRDILLRFDIRSCDAHSFGLVLHADSTQKGHRLRFTPSSGDIYTITLLTDFPPLDDFWADQYKLHLPRPVDGPELVRHDGVSLAGGVTVFLKGTLLEVFCGGRSISFRFPVSVPATPELAAADNGRLGWFVEDGEVELSDVSIRHGGLISKTCM